MTAVFSGCVTPPAPPLGWAIVQRSTFKATDRGTAWSWLVVVVSSEELTPPENYPRVAERCLVRVPLSTRLGQEVML